MEASRRLARRGQAWNAALVSLSVSTAIVAVGLLVDKSLLGSHGDALMACLAILVLAVSLVVPVAGYPRRSRDMFSNYRRMQRLAAEIEDSRASGKEVGDDLHRDFFEQYQSLLDESENHSPADFYKAFARQVRRTMRDGELTPDAERLARALDGVPRRVRFLEASLDSLPWVTLAIPAILIVRLATWLVGAE
jgi:hypothetical protein